MPLIFILVVYWMVGLANSVEQFFKLYLVGLLVTLSGTSLGLLLGSIIEDAKSASIVTPAFIIPFIVFSGFFKNRNDLPAWAGWIEYISPMKYGFTAMTEN
jgi:ABC-type multidrug transport system permease subunit